MESASSPAQTRRGRAPRPRRHLPSVSAPRTSFLGTRARTLPAHLQASAGGEGWG